MVIVRRMASAAESVIDWQSGSNGNILDYWANSVKSAYDAADPGIRINLVAALQTGTDPQADSAEYFDPRPPEGVIGAGIYVNMKEAGLFEFRQGEPAGL